MLLLPSTIVPLSEVSALELPVGALPMVSVVGEEYVTATAVGGNEQEAVGEVADPEQSLVTRCAGRVLHQGRLLDSAPPKR